MNRALRAATIGALLLTPVTVSACSAGQINQTSTQQRDKTGPMATVGALSLREVQLAYPSSGSYAAGDDAELTMTIANGGNEADQLTSITGDGFSGFRISGTGSGPATSSASGSAATTTGSAATATGSAATTTGSSAAGTSGPGTGTSSPSPSAGTSAGSTATGSGIAGATGSPSSASATSSAEGAQTIAIPAQAIVQLGQNPTPHVFLEGLSQSLTPGQRITATFTFAKAGTVTMPVLVAAPSEYIAPTSSFDFTQAPDVATTSSAGQG